LITGLDIVIISSIEWSFLWQGHQEIAMRLARAGNRIFYVENTGIRSPGVRDAGRVASRLKGWIRGLRTSGAREVATNVFVSSPIVMPPFGRGWSRMINRHLLLPLIARTAQDLKIRPEVIWNYLPTDSAIELIRLLALPSSVAIYYCAADFLELASSRSELELAEKDVVKKSDLVFAVCAELAERCQQWRDEAHVFPPGVDLRAFSRDVVEPPDFPERELDQPVIGYVGGLHRYVDYDLLSRMARLRPGWLWVLIGPEQTEVGKLARLQNVRLLGQRDHDSLAGYISRFDVCIVPYIRTTYTNTVVPVKINEYLAMGKPVVSTNIRAVEDFNRQYDVLVTAEPDPDEFLRAIEAALQLQFTQALADRRRAVASLGDWSARVEAMSDLIQQKLAEKDSAVLCPV
jgi:glycosyltransferase involved in cell wall biosynthesis